jgi:hypothetical protein
LLPVAAGPVTSYHCDIRLIESGQTLAEDGEPMSSEATNPPTAPLRTPPQPSTDGQGIALRTSFFALDWTVNFTRTTVIVDGHRQELPWGEHFLPLEPGRHELQVSYRYLRRPEAGKASITVDVAGNQVAHVSYRAPRSVLVAFRPGKLTTEPQPGH